MLEIALTPSGHLALFEVAGGGIASFVLDMRGAKFVGWLSRKLPAEATASRGA
jgi:hypothetical protein